MITLNDVIAIEGLFTKRKIVLPYGSISEVTVNKSIFGRMLNYGDLFLGAFRTGSDIHMKGMRNASRIHEIIQNRINMIRESQIGFFGDKGKEGTEKPKEKGEVKSQRRRKINLKTRNSLWPKSFPSSTDAAQVCQTAR